MLIMKMYILTKDNLPDYMAPVIAAHASLSCYKKFESDPQMQVWINGIFKTVVCKVNATEFEKAKEEVENVLLTESSLDSSKYVWRSVQGQNTRKDLSFLGCENPQIINLKFLKIKDSITIKLI